MPTDGSTGKRTPTYRWTLERDLGDLLAPEEKHVVTRLTTVNLYAARTTDPKRLKDCDNPVGAANDETIAKAARRADLIIAAWGKPPGKAGEARARRVLELLTAGGDVYRIGPATKEGHPPHPLYLPASEAATPLQLHARGSTATDGGNACPPEA